VIESGPNAVPQPSADKIRRRWHFGRSVLDEATHELLVDGVDAELERKPLEVLMYLLHHAGEVCTKDELLAGVWPGRILSETVLTKSIGRLRDVLGDQNQEIIKTAYGFGYRFVAPVRVESVLTPEPVHFDLRPGIHPPGRPLWSLVERLGVGGHGEAWRGRHDKTGEQRVFKFALEEAALVALKREITLFRIINDTLGDAARIVKLLDWNLELLPYFVETEFITGGSLVDWVHLQGGVTSLPLSDRLEIVAKIADALGAVHSVGVLHKDLKPSNVLVKPLAGNTIDIRLADFGSGGVLDFHRLEALGITRLGFTKTIATPDWTSGTPMYLAPEILAGQPFTVKSDIYALGVILYQFVAGDFHKVMSPGWERSVEDELLRQDISLMAEGNPVERLGDAEGLSRRLRSLDLRRRQLLSERDARAKAERARHLLERARAWRLGLTVAFAALVVGLTVSTTLYYKARTAQEHTAIAAAQSRAVTEFLSKDVFSPVSSGNESVKNMTVLSLLTRAGNEIDLRFIRQPEIASQLHYVIGRSFNAFNEYPLSVRHFKRAMELGKTLDGDGGESVLRSAAELIEIDYTLGNLHQTMPRYEAVLAAGEKRLAPDDAALLELKQRIARGTYRLGSWVIASQAFEDLLSYVTRSPTSSGEFIGLTEFYLGQVLTDLARPAEAETRLREAIASLTTRFGATHAQVAEARAALGRAMADAGKFEQAMAELNMAQELATSWAAPDTWTAVRPRYFKALLLLQQDEPESAVGILSQIVEYQDTHIAEYLRAHQDSDPELDHTGPVRQALGEAYAREGKLVDAIATLQKAVTVSVRADGILHPSTQSIQLSLAESFIAAQRYAEARTLLATISSKSVGDLPAPHPIAAQFSRVAGLLALRDGDALEARRSLARCLHIYQSLYGEQHWRVARARRELELVAP
jgi:serine/threonine protein kinase/DNA-binding winged helix-turn-helix (wHTH) protein